MASLLISFLRQPPAGWLEALLVTTAFAVGGLLLRGVDLGGAAAGAVVAFILYSGGEWKVFAVLVVVFVLTLLATLAGSGRKRKLGLAEPHSGRSAAQVTANLFVATAAFVALGPKLGLVVAAAALAEAAADTVSSEIGEAFGRKTYLVTTLRETSPGTNGGVSVLGTLAGVGAAAAVAAAAWPLVGTEDAVLAAVGGILGMLVDSVLGATLENKGYLTNDAVNVLGTTSTAVIVILICLLWNLE